MKETLFFENINILYGDKSEVIKDSILIVNGKIKAFGEAAKKEAKENKIKNSEAGSKLIAPLLIDIHSTLKDPLTGCDDNLENLKSRAKKSGFGGIALLPESNIWRDSPEKIPFQKNTDFDINIYFWASFSLENKGLRLAPHKELLKSGVVGLSSSNFFDSSIVFNGLSLNSEGSCPLLFSLISKNTSRKGIVKKDLRSLQSGFFTINDYFENSHVKNILQIKKFFPNYKIIIKNISESNALEELAKTKTLISTSTSWWNLLADTDNLKLDDMGWKVDPPLGSAKNRENLIKGLENNLIQAIAVNSYPLNEENSYIPINEREAGISAYELVLPLLWDEFINQRKWPISQLWKFLSFNPSTLLGINREKLSIGSKRWLLFDPEKKWLNNQINLGYDSPSNFPKKNESINGKIIAVGLDF